MQHEDTVSTLWSPVGESCFRLCGPYPRHHIADGAFGHRANKRIFVINLPYQPIPPYPMFPLRLLHLLLVQKV